MKTIYALLTIVAFLTVTKAATAGDGCCCPDCGEKVCSFKWEEKDVKKHCYCVECKDICIPKFRWPWECCSEPKCGRVKTVNVLKKINYKCKACGYKWEVYSVNKSCKCGCGNGNCNGSCGQDGCGCKTNSADCGTKVGCCTAKSAAPKAVTPAIKSASLPPKPNPNIRLQSHSTSAPAAPHVTKNEAILN